MNELSIEERIKENSFNGPHGPIISILEFENQELDEENLKKIVAKVGPFSIIGGTTELDIPRFLRDKNYEMYSKDVALRVSIPELFSTYEIYVTTESVEKRTLTHKRENGGYFHYDILNDRIEKTAIEDPLNPEKYKFS